MKKSVKGSEDDILIAYAPTQMDKLVCALEALEIGKFFGSFEIIWESGYITHCKKTESIKL